MEVTELVRREALLRCYAKLKVDLGGRLFLRTLETVWVQEGLRQTDLIDALDEASQRQMVTVERDDDAQDLLVTLVRLTPPDESTTPVSSRVQRSRASLVLRHARKRPHPGVLPEQDRRAV